MAYGTRRGLRRPGPAGIALALCGALQARAACELDAFDWTEFNEAQGTTLVKTTGGDCTLLIIGGDAYVPGDTELKTTAPAALTISVTVEYTSNDSGVYDQAYYSVNGEKTIITTNAVQGEFDFTVEVSAGDTFAFGVATGDGLFGAGELEVLRFEARSEPVSHRLVPWSFGGAPGDGQGMLTGGCMEIIGGDNGVASLAGFVHFPVCLSGEVTGTAVYVSEDVGAFDRSFYAFNEEVDTIATNAGQGTFELFIPIEASNTVGGGQNQFSFGVETIDGLSGPGVLAVREGAFRAAPQRMEDFNWLPSDVLYYVGYDFDEKTGELIAFHLIGPDSGSAGTTDVMAPACAEMVVLAEVTYASEDVQDYDKAFYLIDDVKFFITDNSAPGTFDLEFTVPAGSTFGFMVESVDGLGGSGVLEVKRFRTFVKGLEPCPADFNADGQLNVADFVAFQGAFSSERLCADLNADGSLGVLDFIAFQNAFGAGCQPLP